MRKIFLFLVALMIMAIIFIGCSDLSQSKPEQGSIEQNQSEEDKTIPDSGSLENSQETNPESYETKIDSGRYQGQADSNFIEIKISGVPDAIAAKVFMLSDEIKEKFDQLNLKKDDEIKFSYFQDQNGQPVIIKIEIMAATMSD